MNLSNEEKLKIEAMDFTCKTPGWKVLEEYFIREIFNSVTKHATEKDIAFNAGIKEVFDHAKRKVSILDKRTN